MEVIKLKDEKRPLLALFLRIAGIEIYLTIRKP